MPCNESWLRSLIESGSRIHYFIPHFGGVRLHVTRLLCWCLKGIVCQLQNKGMQDDFPVDRYRAATGAGGWGLLHSHGASHSSNSSALGNGSAAMQRRELADAIAADDRPDNAGAASGRVVQSGSNDVDLPVTVEEGLAQTPSSRSPIAAAAAADLARFNGSSQGASPPHAEAETLQPVSLEAADEAWEPSWPTVDVDAATPAEQAEPPHGMSPVEASSAVDPAAVERGPAAAVQVSHGQQASPAQAGTEEDSPLSTGGLASGSEEQPPATRGQSQGSESTAVHEQQPAASLESAAVEGVGAESVPIADRGHGDDIQPSADDGSVVVAVQEQPADAAAVHPPGTASG